MSIEYRDHITRQMLCNEPHKLFVFGDNLRREGYGGQAREMRGEPNAVGIPTKVAPSMDENAFFTNQHYNKWLLESLPDCIRLYKFVCDCDGGIVWPKAGIGTGLAQLSQRAPIIATAISGFLTVLQYLSSNPDERQRLKI